MRGHRGICFHYLHHRHRAQPQPVQIELHSSSASPAERGTRAGAGVPQDFLNTEANLNAHERRQWRMRMEGTTNWEPETREQFERRYHEEIAERNSKVSS